MIFLKKQFTTTTILYLMIFNISFYSCDNKEYQDQISEEVLDSSYLAFAERTNDMFSQSSYPMFFPFEEGVIQCNGFQLCFNRNINITDTIQGIIEIKDSKGITIDYQLEGFDQFFLKNKKDNEIYIFPKKEGIIGFYFYTFKLPENKIPYTIKFITPQKTMVLYKDGDKKGTPRESYCTKIIRKQDSLPLKT